MTPKKSPRWWRLIAAQTTGEARRALIIRAALIDALIQDDRVQSAFDEWSKRAGFDLSAVDVMDAAHGLALQLGLSSRYELFVDRPADASRLNDIAKTHASDLFAGSDRVIQQLHDAMPDGMAMASTLLEELGLEKWPWIAVELMERFLNDTIDAIFGRRREEEPIIERTFAPEMSYTFTTLEWETVEDARARLTAEFADLLKRLEMKPGRAPRTNIEYLQRNARWFYEHKVRHPPTSQRELARQHQEHEEAIENHVEYDTARWTVRDGILEVERLLDLAVVVERGD